MKKIRLIIADDQGLIAQSIKFVVESMAQDMEVLALAENGRIAIELVEKERPDVVLMDIRMPDIDGIEATRIIHKKYPKIKIIMLTTFDDEELIRSSVLAGSVGYLLKDISTEELITAIRAVFSGAILMSPETAAKLYHHSISENKPDSQNYPEWYSFLTEREIELLKLLKLGNSNKEISEKVYLAEQTAEEIKIKIGTAIPEKEKREIEIRGRDLVSGLPQNIKISSNEVAEAISAPLLEIIHTIKLVLRETPPELSADIMDKGMVISGGGALLRNIDELIARETGVSCFVAENPLLCVAKGTDVILENLNEYKRSIMMKK